MTDTAPRRPGGRPRSTEIDVAVLDAAAALFAEVGLRGVSIERIAGRAGVADTTVYRRYASTDAVLLALIDRIYRDVTVPDTGNVRDDLVVMMREVNQVWTHAGNRRFIAALVLAMAENEHVAAAYQRIQNERRQRTRVIIERGRNRGELKHDTDPDVVLDLLSGLVGQRILITHQPLVPPELAVDSVLSGALRAPTRP